MKYKWWVDGLDGGGVADTKAEAIAAANSAIAALGVASLKFSVAPAMHVVDKLDCSAYIYIAQSMMDCAKDCFTHEIDKACNVSFDEHGAYTNIDVIKNFLKAHMTGDVYHADYSGVTHYIYMRG